MAVEAEQSIVCVVFMAVEAEQSIVCVVNDNLISSCRLVLDRSILSCVEVFGTLLVCGKRYSSIFYVMRSEKVKI